MSSVGLGSNQKKEGSLLGRTLKELSGKEKKKKKKAKKEEEKESEDSDDDDSDSDEK